ncbi:hypothetical protein ACHAXN_003422 [Cyclotella atomus]|jgi:hypothetical protein
MIGRDSSLGLQLTAAATSPGDSKLHSDDNPTPNNEVRTSTKVRGPNVLIMSGAGKPIFVRYGNNDRTSSDMEHHDEDEDQWATACSLIQAIRANAMSFGLDSDESAPLGDIQSIKAGRKIIVFMNTEALTLVAIGDEALDTEFMHLHLEYAYAQVIFTLTNQVNTIFRRSPNYDLRTMMGPNVNASIRNLLDRFDPVEIELDNLDGGHETTYDHGSGYGSFLTAAVECISPIPPELRDEASKLLIAACRFDSHRNRSRHSQVQDPLFAILMIGTKLVTLVQPSNVSSQLHTSDMHLILTFVGLQPGLLTNELWFPICLPRFDSSGFLYAFTSCLDPGGTGLSIVLISPNNSTEQFEAFRLSAMTLRKSLGLPPAKTNVLRIYDSSSSVSSSVATPVAGNRARARASEDDTLTTTSGHSDDPEKHFDDTAWQREETDDYISEEDDDTGGRAPRIKAKSKTHTKRQTLAYKESPIIDALKIALSSQQKIALMSRYLDIASAVHFVFRCEIFNHSNNHSPGGMLAQCFGPPIGFPFVDAASQRHVWNTYQKLSLRLRLGSASSETTMDAFDMIVASHDENNIDLRGISRECPMQCLLESSPFEHGVTYIQENNEWLHVGLNGKFFELYATLPGSISPKTGTAYCARLVRTLMGDERSLFLSNPLTWGS